jgi:hypothetical protein
MMRLDGVSVWAGIYAPLAYIEPGGGKPGERGEGFSTFHALIPRTLLFGLDCSRGRLSGCLSEQFVTLPPQLRELRLCARITPLAAVLIPKRRIALDGEHLLFNVG